MKSETLDAQREIVKLLKGAGYEVTASEITEHDYDNTARIKVAVELEHEADDTGNRFRVK